MTEAKSTKTAKTTKMTANRKLSIKDGEYIQPGEVFNCPNKFAKAYQESGAASVEIIFDD